MKNYVLLMIALVAGWLVSCNTIEPEMSASANKKKVYNLRYTNEGRTVHLTWNIDADSTMCGVQIARNGENPVDVDSLITSYTVKHVTPNQDVLYTVKIRYNDSIVSEGVSVRVHVNYDLPVYAGYVMSVGSIAELPDDDERAAAEWFDRTYVQQNRGRFIPIGEIGNVNLDEVACLWVHIDRQGMPIGWQNLTGGFSDPAFIANLKGYVAEGGNLYLSVHATQLLVAIGRITEAQRPNEVSTGQGGWGPDVWTMNAYLGAGSEPSYDRRGYSFFEGMKLDVYNNYEYTSFPMISAGVREDHNCIWNLSDIKFTSGSDKIRGWELATKSTALATWGQNTELNHIGLVDFAISGDYRGRIVAMGLGCYEWAQQDGNAFQYQIEKLTENIIEALRK